MVLQKRNFNSVTLIINSSCARLRYGLHLGFNFWTPIEDYRTYEQEIPQPQFVPVSLVVGDDLDLAVLEDANAGVGGPEVNTDGGFLGHCDDVLIVDLEREVVQPLEVGFEGRMMRGTRWGVTLAVGVPGRGRSGKPIEAGNSSWVELSGNCRADENELVVCGINLGQII